MPTVCGVRAIWGPIGEQLNASLVEDGGFIKYRRVPRCMIRKIEGIHKSISLNHEFTKVWQNQNFVTKNIASVFI